MAKALIALLLAGLPLLCHAHDACDDPAPIPSGWQRIYGRALSFRAPPGATIGQIQSEDSTVDLSNFSGQTAAIESGMAHLVGASRDMREGDAPAITLHDSDADAKYLTATWMLDKTWSFVVVLRMQYRNSDEKARACAVIRSARPLPRIDGIKLVRVVVDGKQRCAVLRDAHAQRYACPGAYITRDYGRLVGATSDGMEVLELVREEPDRTWRERRTVLPSRSR